MWHTWYLCHRPLPQGSEEGEKRMEDTTQQEPSGSDLPTTTPQTPDAKLRAAQKKRQEKQRREGKPPETLNPHERAPDIS